MKIRHKILFSMAIVVIVTGLSVNARQTLQKGNIKTDSITTRDTLGNNTKTPAENSVIDEVVWVVGDEPILKSDVEAVRMQAEVEGKKWNGNPDCVIPEQIAVQKLFLHQAAIDSLKVTESEVAQGVEDQINYWIQLIGSKEKLEEYRKQTITQMRQSLRDDFRNNKLIALMKNKLVENVKVSPADVRRYFKNMPKDSIPFVPTEVEVEIITQTPKAKPEEINRIKEELREYTERVVKGETTFATLARLYSQDGSARQGGELGYMSRGALDPAFAAVAFNLTDPKKISKIVETEFGFHIIQLIDKRGDKVNVRHIILKPQIAQDAINKACVQLDSISNDIRNGKFTFEEVATYISDDKDTKNNHGLMAFANPQTGTLTSRFRMRDLATEIAKVVEGMKVGDISKPFTMINMKGKIVCAIIKLKNRVEGHRATITEDFQVMKNVVLEKERMKTLNQWVTNKIKQTYVKMNDKYKNCTFEYQGWIK